MRLALAVFTSLLLVGCNERSTTENAAIANDAAAMDIEQVPANEAPPGESGASAAVTDAWVGKWTGPEGLALDIARAATPGRYDLTVTLLDGSETYSGTADGEVIRFTRGGAEETIRAATGDETGLKYLAGKQDCLMIKAAEGFCRG